MDLSWANLVWDGDRLVRCEVEGAVVDGAVIEDPLLGAAHAIAAPGGRTAMTALDWARPTEIPAVANPAVLGGAGSALLNLIAALAQRAGVTALRYAGPYPTPALWRSLLRSFRTAGTEQAFTADLVERMARRARDPIPIDFAPAPHERVAVAGGHVELRDGLERAVLDGIAYERGGSPARLVEDALTETGPQAHASVVRAELWFGDTRYAHVATFARDALVDGPHAIPACTSEVVGAGFPPALVGAIAELVAETVPPPLARDARRWLASREIRWADLGARAASVTPDGIAVHAALWQHVGPHGLGRLALALAEALAPVVTRAVVADVLASTA